MAIGTGAILAGSGIASTLGSALFGSSMSRRAAQAQANAMSGLSPAAYDAIINAGQSQRAALRGALTDASGQIMPWRTEGLNILENYYMPALQRGPGDFAAYMESPYYKTLLARGTAASERGAAARGGLLSGAQAKALTRYGQENASLGYRDFLSDYYNRLNALGRGADMGYTAGRQIGDWTMDAGRGIAASYGAQGSGLAGAYGNELQGRIYAGDAAARNYMNQANIFTGASRGISNNLLLAGALYGGGRGRGGFFGGGRASGYTGR